MQNSCRRLKPIEPGYFGNQRLHDPGRLPFPKRHLPHMLRRQGKFSRNFRVGPGQEVRSFELADNIVRSHGEEVPFAYVNERNAQARKKQRLNMPVEKSSKPRWAQKMIEARKKLAMNQMDFSSALETSQQNVSKWERGIYRPAPDVFVKIAGLVDGVDKFFWWEEAGLPSEYFMGTAEKTMPSELVRATETVIAKSFTPVGDRAKKTAEAALVPLLAGAAAAGSPLAVDGSDVEEYLAFPKKMLPESGTIVAVRVKGDSMAPLVNDGDTVMIDLADRDPKKLVGKMVAAHDGSGVTVKFLRRDRQDFMLIPYNVSPRHDVMVFRPKEGWTIVGAVVLWIGKPRNAKR